MPYDMLQVIKQARQRRKRVLRLHNQGLKIREIAAIYDISRQRAHALLKAAMQEAIREK